MADGTTPLSVRERILDLWAAGNTAPEIGGWTDLDPVTVRQIVRLGRRHGDTRAGCHHGGHKESWEPEKVARLKELWATGIPCSQIAEKMGQTRNAIIGKVHRLKLPPRENIFSAESRKRRLNLIKPIQRQRNADSGRIRAIQKARSAEPAAVELPLPAIPPDCKPVSIMDIGHNQCRAIIGGQGPETMFCAGPTIEGQSWCLFHFAAFCQSSERRERMMAKTAQVYPFPAEVPFDG